MASMDKAVRKAFIKYTKEHFLKRRIRSSGRQMNCFRSCTPRHTDIGGKENLMAYNLDLMILSASFYEASDHRIDGPAINEMAKEIFAKYGFVRHFVNVNHKWQMKLASWNYMCTAAMCRMRNWSKKRSPTVNGETPGV